MIRLTRLNGQVIFLNAEIIEFLESTPDTVITLIGGKTVMVRENLRVVLNRVLHYRRRIHEPLSERPRKKEET